MSGILVDAHWRTLTRVIGQPELGEDPRYATNLDRIEHRDEVHRIVDGWMAQQTVTEVVNAFAEAGIPAAPVQTYAEAAKSDVVRERDMLQTIETEGNPIPVPGPPAKFSRTPTRVRSGAPALGAHNDQLLEELGYAEQERKELRSEGITASKDPAS